MLPNNYNYCSFDAGLRIQFLHMPLFNGTISGGSKSPLVLYLPSFCFPLDSINIFLEFHFNIYCLLSFILFKLYISAVARRTSATSFTLDGAPRGMLCHVIGNRNLATVQVCLPSVRHSLLLSLTCCLFYVIHLPVL